MPISPPPAESRFSSSLPSLLPRRRALAKLNIGIPVEDVIEAVYREEEAKRATLTAQATKRRAALSKRNSTPQSLYFP